ncbi:MAG: hypothetical protein EXS08_12670 [Planctomycetes bacterium]|nr:hypothetical protein [Planctomycetota bacterium]
MHTRTLAFALLLAPTFGFAPQEPAPAAFLCPPCGAECHFVVYAKAGACGGCGMALVPAASVPQVGVLLHEGVDLLSSTLTLGVFAASNCVRAFTVADTAEPLRAADALEMKPQFAFAAAPALDVLVVPEGFGSWDDPLIVDYVRGAAEHARFVIAVGTGSVLLAKAGFLKGAHVALNPYLVRRLPELAPELVSDPTVRLARTGKFFLARDALAAADAGLAVLRELVGEERARKTAEGLGLTLGPPVAEAAK